MNSQVRIRIYPHFSASNQFPVLKQNRITAIASENGLPLIALVQSVSTFSSSISQIHTLTYKILCPRPVFSSLNNFACSTKVAKYFETSPSEQRMVCPVVLWSLDLPLLEGRTTRLCLTIQYLFRTRHKCSWVDLHW